MIQGLVFNIQRFSIHDGPGIRTTVFFKGCPLRCPWCANPESNLPYPQLLHTPANCLGCKLCSAACPQNCISFDSKIFKYDLKACTNCGACVRACLPHALSMEGTWYTVHELLEEIRKDDVFYEKSGGGITLSGGEPLQQEPFVLNLLKELKKNNYHTNIETTGYTSAEYLQQILPYLDLLYIDFKHPDHERHRQVVGVGNEIIIKNIAYVVSKGTPLIVRIPVIPRFNHSVESARSYGQILIEAGVRDVHLLPFHQMGLGKWTSLGITYEYAKDKSMKEEKLIEMAEVLKEYGLNVQISGS